MTNFWLKFNRDSYGYIFRLEDWSEAYALMSEKHYRKGEYNWIDKYFVFEDSENELLEFHPKPMTITEKVWV